MSACVYWLQVLRISIIGPGKTAHIGFLVALMHELADPGKGSIQTATRRCRRWLTRSGLRGVRAEICLAALHIWRPTCRDARGQACL